MTQTFKTIKCLLEWKIKVRLVLLGFSVNEQISFDTVWRDREVWGFHLQLWSLGPATAWSLIGKMNVSDFGYRPYFYRHKLLFFIWKPLQAEFGGFGCFSEVSERYINKAHQGKTLCCGVLQMACGAAERIWDTSITLVNGRKGLTCQETTPGRLRLHLLYTLPIGSCSQELGPPLNLLSLMLTTGVLSAHLFAPLP